MSDLNCVHNCWSTFVEYLTSMILNKLYPPSILSAIPKNFINFAEYHKPALKISLLDTEMESHDGIIDDYFYSTADERKKVENETSDAGLFSKFGFAFTG